MEKYVINGHEVEFDTFDLGNLALYQEETKRVLSVSEQAKSNGDYIATLKAECHAMLDFFDTILGDGMSGRIFGGRINVKVIFDAYSSFVSDVSETLRSYSGSLPAPDSDVSNILDMRIQQDTEEKAEERARRRAAALEAVSR